MDKKFIDFALHMGESSMSLIDLEKYHSGVYLGGYALEGYLKAVLINDLGYNSTKLFLHLNQLKKSWQLDIYDQDCLHKEVEIFLSLKSDLINTSLLLKSHKNYPALLINGGSDIIKEKKWDVHERYNIEQWSEKDYALKIKKEIENIMKEIVEQYLTNGGIK